MMLRPAGAVSENNLNDDQRNPCVGGRWMVELI
jgi:hypothetical protein